VREGVHGNAIGIDFDAVQQIGDAARRARDVLSQVDERQVAQVRYLADHRLQLRPQIRARKGGERHQHRRTAGAQQFVDRLRLQHRVDREDDAAGLSTPDHKVCLGQVGQNVGNHVVLADAQPVEEFGRGGDLTEQRGVVPGQRLLVVLCAQEKGQRREVRVRGSSLADQLIGAGW
jgi:hypothetical protein